MDVKLIEVFKDYAQKGIVEDVGENGTI